MKKKLLMFHPVIAPYRIDLVNELSKAYDVKLCLMRNYLRSQKFDIETLYRERLLVDPAYAQINKKSGKIEYVSYVWNNISLFNPNIVLVSEFGVVAGLVILHKIIHRARYKIVSMIDDSYDMVANNHYLSYKHQIAQKLLMPFIDQIVNVDYRAVDWYNQRYGKGIYFPIVSDDVIYRNRLKSILPISEQYVRKYNLAGKKVLLYVGRLAPEKNLPVAIKAFLNAKVKDSVFLIVGGGAEAEKLHRLVGNDKSVLFLGRHEGDSLYAWYNVAHTFILPSIQEPFGAVTNEALMAGCWALVSEVAGSSSLVEEN